MKLKNIFVGLFLIAGISTASAAVSITKEAGWLESVYAQWTPLSEYTNYHAYIRPQGGTYTQLDQYLLRNYGTYCRVDAVGLKAGKYQLKIVPVDASGNEVAAQAKETAVLTATAYDRNGYAHFNEKYNGIGAYKNDGTLKSGAKVFYVTANTAKKITTNVITNKNGSTTTCTGMQAIINAYQKGLDTTPLCFRIIGTIATSNMDELGSSAEGLQIKGKGADSELNITIEGIGNDAFINGFGFLLRNAASVEIRNIGVRTLMDDGISLDTDNDHIWLHHIDVFYGKSSGGDHAKGDGAIDVKSDSKHVTIAYCHFWDTGKSTMCGMTSESGENWITYHHNWFDHSDSRHPRIRTMSVHIYNNYFDGNAKYGVGSTTHSDVFVENNYFRNCAKPMMISLQGTDTKNGTDTKDAPTFSGEAGGMIKSYGNVMTGTYTYRTYQQDNTQFDAYEATSRNEQVPATVKALSGGATYNNFDTDASKIYSYTPDAAKDVPTIIKGEYGAGRCEHGDFQFTFTDADDTDYNVNSKLKAALDSYKSSLISIVGNSDTISPNPDPTPGGDEDGDGDGDDDDDDPTPTPGGEYECHFTNKTPSSSFYTVSAGNYSDSKGTFTAPNGTTYKVCLKMESSTSVKFTTTAAFTLYLGFDKEDPNIKIDGTKVNGSNKVITYELAAGSHELTKADSHNLYYINLISKGDDGGDGDDDGGDGDGDDDGSDEDTAIDETTTTMLFFDGQQVLNPEGEEVRIYTVTGNAVLVSSETTIDATVLPQGMYIGVGESTSLRFFIH